LGELLQKVVFEKISNYLSIIKTTEKGKKIKLKGYLPHYNTKRINRRGRRIIVISEDFWRSPNN